MPQISSGSKVLLVIDYVVSGQHCLLTHHYRVETNFGGSFDMDLEFTAMFSTLDGFGEMFSLFGLCMSDQITDVHASLQVIDPIRYVKRTYTPANGTGQVAGNNLPPNVAHAITCRGEFAGPRYRGTKHIGGVPPSFTANGVMTPAGASAYGDLAECFPFVYDPNGDSTTSWTPILYHRAVPNNSPQIFDAVLGTSTRVERRRTVGLGI